MCPLAQIGDNLFVLELFHGPTLAFKDVAMQLLGQLMNHVLRARGTRATIIGATSGDTGSAAVEAFKGLDQVDVFILYPHGRVSEVQRRQMTGVDAPNVHVIALEGTFDDCQAVVKALFNHARFRDELQLSGVNSINWARIAAQTVYYFTAAVALGGPHRPISFAVPTGNFGDILAAWVAQRMGLPVGRLMLATNANDILARTLATGTYELRGVVPTTSPSMDIQISSNFERLLFEAYGRDAAAVRRLMASLAQSRAFTIAPEALARIRRDFAAEAVGEEAVLAEIRDTWAEAGYLLDPHTAVGVRTARTLLAREPGTPVVALATAHPSKFPDAVERATGVRPSLPAHLADLLDRRERFTVLPNDQGAVEALHPRAGAGRARRRRMNRHFAEAGDPAIRIAQLANGFTVVTEAMPQVATATLGVWVGAGSRHERPHEHGLSHLIEHMAFKGTARRTARQIAEDIENVGGDINAATSTEYTAYTARVLGENVDLAIDVLGDILMNSVFDPGELAREKGVILQECASVEDTPDDLVGDVFMETAFAGQAIGRPILGTPATIGSFTPECDPRLHGARIHARSHGAGGGGAVEHEAVVAGAEAAFGGLPAAEPGETAAGRYVGGERRLRRKLEQANVLLGLPGCSFKDPRFYATHMFAQVLGGGLTSRLWHEVREQRGLAYSIDAFLWPFSDCGLFGIGAGTAAADLPQLVEVSIAAARQATRDVEAIEVDRAKAQLKMALLAALETPGGRIERNARQLLAFGRIIPGAEVVARIDAVAADEVRGAGADLLAGEPTLAAIGPDERACRRCPGSRPSCTAEGSARLTESISFWPQTPCIERSRRRVPAPIFAVQEPCCRSPAPCPQACRSIRLGRQPRARCRKVDSLFGRTSCSTY